ncbi:hypothetical protein BaRGS_00027201, partial [Batillaria attramentaria]
TCFSESWSHKAGPGWDGCGLGVCVSGRCRLFTAIQNRSVLKVWTSGKGFIRAPDLRSDPMGGFKMLGAVLVTALCVLPIMAQQLTLMEKTCDAQRRRASFQTTNANTVLLGGLFNIRDPGTDGVGCGLPRLVQNYEAAVWTIDLINKYNNNQGYLNGVKFGLEAFDTCLQTGNALQAVQEFYPQSASRQLQCALSSNQYKLGLIGPMSSWEAVAVGEMIPRVPASTVSMRASAPELSRKSLYPTFLRTYPSSSVFAKAIISMLKQINWERIIAVYTDDSYGRGLYMDLLRAAYEGGTCINGAIELPHGGSADEYRTIFQNKGFYDATAAVFLGAYSDALTKMEALQSDAAAVGIRWLYSDFDLDADLSSYTAARGALFITPSTVEISEFKEYFIGLDERNPPAHDPWLADWYMNDPIVERTILSIFAYVEAVRMVCGNSGVCQTLRNMDPRMFHDTYLSKVDFTFPNDFSVTALRGRRVAFDVNGDPLTSAFTFYQYNLVNAVYTYQEVGTYDSGTVQVLPAANVPESRCPGGVCGICLQPMQGITLAYSPGDVVIAAVVNAHEQGTLGVNCGAAIPDRLIDAVAARYAAENAAANAGLNTKGVTVGYLIVDVCPGVDIARSFLTSLLGGFEQYVDNSGRIITTNNIIAFIDMTEEDTGMQMSPLLTQMGIPQIRVASTSAMYLENDMYPMLVSAIPSQDVVQLAVVQMLSSLSWRYVQVVSEARGSYYRAAENFRRMASRMNICVALWSTFDMDTSATVRRMLQNQNAPVVIVFGSRMHVRSLLEAVRTEGAQNRLNLVSGTVNWADSASMVSGYSTEASGALTVGLSASASSAFQTYLQQNNNLNAISNNIFLAEWFQEQFSCALTSLTRGRYNRVCTTSDSITTVPRSYSPYVISTVFTVARAVNSILGNICGTTNGICAQFRGATDIGKRITDYVRNSNANSEFRIADGMSMTNLGYYNYRRGAYSSVGSFDTTSRRLSSLSATTIETASGAMANTVSSQCSGRCLECQYMYQYQNFAYMPGDWLIGATFSISNPGPMGQMPFVCGDVRMVNGFQYSAAMMYAMHQVNSGNIVTLRNITLGGFVMDHCNNPRRAYGQVSDIYSGLTEMNWMHMMNNMPSFRSQEILAWMTDNTASTKEAAEILQPLGVAIVSPSATSDSLMDNPTFFRTIQGDRSIAMAIVKLCKDLGFSYIQVVYAANDYGREGLETLTNTARQEGLCVVNSFELDDAANADVAVSTLAQGTSRVVVMYMGTSLTQAFLQAASRSTDRLTLISPEPYTQIVRNVGVGIRNLLSLQLRNPVIADFNNYLNDVSRNGNNPFFALYYMKILQCNLPGYNMYNRDCSNGEQITTNGGFESSNFVLSTMNAVLSVAAALDVTLQEFCGQNYTHECSAFLKSDDAYNRFVANLKVVSFTDPSSRLFRFLEREGNVVYDVLRFDGTSYNIVGNYGGASLVLNGGLKADYSGVRSDCSLQCLECIYTGLTFSYTPGNIFLGGVFDVHGRGSGVFNCGDINKMHGFQLLEAFHFALNQVNRKEGMFADILKGVTLGGVGLDACESAIKGGYIVSNINNGLTELVRGGRRIRPEDIDVYIGPYLSDSSIYLARILTDLKIPQISYAATSNTLEDQRIYPYFFRTVPADDKQVRAMLSYLDKNNIRYVQLLYTNDSYGQQGVAQFERIIRMDRLRVCVAQKVVFPESGVVSEESSDDVVNLILQKPAANTTVIFAGTKYIRAFLEAVQRAVRRSPALRGSMKFLGPTTWGNNADVTNGIDAVANDAVTLMMDFQSIRDFEAYMVGRDPSNSANNPWFEEWFQTVLNCYTSPSNDDRFPRQCRINEELSSVFSEDSGVLHVINAVYSAAFALDATLKEKCGSDYSAVCEAYRNDKDRREAIRNNLENVNFTDPTGARFQFNDREGNKGYTLYRVTERYNYLQIGNYSGDGVLGLDMDAVPDYDGSCERKDACSECPTIRNRGVRYAVGGNPDGKITVIGIFDVHKQGNESYQCGLINMDGFQKFLSFFYTFEQVMPFNDVRLIALDTCSNSMRVGQDLYGLLSEDGKLCNSQFDIDSVGLDSVGAILVTGEENTMAASRVLEQLQVSYVSPDARSVLLDDKMNLARTISPHSGLWRVLSNFLKQRGWSYVNSVYVNSGLGRQQYSVFQQLSGEYDVCLAGGLALPENPSDADISTALTNMRSNRGANVVVLFSDAALTVRILRVAQSLGIIDDYFWVFGFEYEDALPDMTGISFEGIMLQQKTRTVDSFNEFIKNLDYDVTQEDRNRENIPRVWWEDFYQTRFMCRLSDARYPLEYNRECSKDAPTGASNVMHTKYILNTILATISTGDGLQNQFEAGGLCRSGEGLSACFRRGAISRRAIFNSILDVTWDIQDYAPSFNVTPNDPLRFLFNKNLRYWDAGYDVYYMRRPWWSWQDGTFSALPLSGVSVTTTSECTRADGCGCKSDTAFADAQTGDSFNPEAPRNYYKYDSRGNQVYKWPIWAIVVAVLTGVGLLITVAVFLYLLIFYPVKGGTSVLGYMVMIGIIGVYAINFAFFLHASDATCGARRFVMGVVYAIVFAALLVKAVDNWRFAESEYGNHQYRGLTSSVTLFLIAFGIVLVQCIIPIEWLILVPPTASKWTDATMHDYWWCDPHDMYDIGLVCSFIFVMFLVLLTAIFAALAWDSESNNQESRWILAAAITTAGPVYRDPAVAIANFINATLLLICIPLRKLHLLCVSQNEKDSFSGDPHFDPYSNVYNNQSFDPEGEEYPYEVTEKQGSTFHDD